VNRWQFCYPPFG